MKQATITINGFSEGDSSVGINSIRFDFDTGLYELSDDDKQYIREYIIVNIFELHDNGRITYTYSNEEEDVFYTLNAEEFRKIRGRANLTRARK